MKSKVILVICCLLFTVSTQAQLMQEKKSFTHADTLRGSLTKYRQGWDVLSYELTVQPDIAAKRLQGKNTMTYWESLAVKTMQIDLQAPMVVDSIVSENGTSYKFNQQGDVCFVYIRDSLAMYKIQPGKRVLTIYFSGQPKIAKRAPWDGGLIWNKDSTGNPYVATACQGLGASVWWPCKDHQSDEPDSGMVIHLIAPDSLVAVSNGRLMNKVAAGEGNNIWTWQVRNPINTYDVTMNIGKYTNWKDTLMGEGGVLDLSYWVLDYHLERAKQQFAQVKPMLRSHEYWFGKYPFYEDSYKLVETPFLGMEHQSAVAYGNHFLNGYLGKDLSGTGWGLKWDFIIIHESGHEWFGNNITTKDIADMWVHEGFTNYSEALYVEFYYGIKAGNEYVVGIRKNIRNDQNIIGFYGVNKEGSGDTYPKAANMLHSIRHAMNNDSLFRSILRGLNKDFYHQTVTTAQVEKYISEHSGMNFSKVFDQYLRSLQVPVLQYYFSKNKKTIHYRYTNCVDGFNLPLNITTDAGVLALKPTKEWKTKNISKTMANTELGSELEKSAYVTTNFSSK